MEKTAAIDNNRNFYRLIMNAGPRKPSVSEVIKDFDGWVSHTQERSTGHFRGQLNWSNLMMDLFMPATRKM